MGAGPGAWPAARREGGSGGAGAGMAGAAWAPPRLDGFILTERLGAGTYATVYKAYRKVGPGPRRGGPPTPWDTPCLQPSVCGTVPIAAVWDLLPPAWGLPPVTRLPGFPLGG